MSYILAKFYGNWADEMDLEGFWCGTEATWEKYKDLMKVVEFPRNKYIGTNEVMSYSDLEEYLRCFSVRYLSLEEYETVKKLFCSAVMECDDGFRFGKIVWFHEDEIKDILEEQGEGEVDYEKPYGVAIEKLE